MIFQHLIATDEWSLYEVMGPTKFVKNKTLNLLVFLIHTSQRFQSFRKLKIVQPFLLSRHPTEKIPDIILVWFLEELSDILHFTIFYILKVQQSFCLNIFYVFSWYFAANGKPCSTLPSAGFNLKSSLSKTSLKKSPNYKFETDSNLQQIVKQKRENCLQVW